MQRLLIALGAAAFLAATAAPALADDYPPCTHKDQDHCRVVTTHWDHGHHHGHDHGHHKHHHSNH